MSGCEPTRRPRPTATAGLACLLDHAADRAAACRAEYGAIDSDVLAAVLADRRFVRYPVALAFDRARLAPGEFAWPEPLGPEPADGFRLWIHDALERRPDLLPLVIAYHLVTVNYGDIATHETAEVFGATLLGLDQEDYYRRLCAIADGLAA